MSLQKNRGPQVEELVLAELKVISCCPTRYKRVPRTTTKAVDRRAATLPAEYRQHAKKIDREYGGVQEGSVGPVEAKLLSFPPPYGGGCLGLGGRPPRMFISLLRTLQLLGPATSSSWRAGGGGIREARRLRSLFSLAR